MGRGAGGRCEGGGPLGALLHADGRAGSDIELRGLVGYHKLYVRWLAVASLACASLSLPLYAVLGAQALTITTAEETKPRNGPC